MMENLEKLSDFVKEMNWYDKVMFVLYGLVFSTLGVLMKTDVIPYPKKVMELFEDMAREEKLYTWYIIIFLLIFLVNLVVFILFVSDENGTVRQFKARYGDRWYTEYQGPEKMIGNISSSVLSIIINIWMFPVFIVIYICIIGVGFLLMMISSSNSNSYRRY